MNSRIFFRRTAIFLHLAFWLSLAAVLLSLGRHTWMDSFAFSNRRWSVAFGTLAAGGIFHAAYMAKALVERLPEPYRPPAAAGAVLLSPLLAAVGAVTLLPMMLIAPVAALCLRRRAAPALYDIPELGGLARETYLLRAGDAAPYLKKPPRSRGIFYGVYWAVCGIYLLLAAAFPLPLPALLIPAFFLFANGVVHIGMRAGHANLALAVLTERCDPGLLFCVYAALVMEEKNIHTRAAMLLNMSCALLMWGRFREAQALLRVLPQNAMRDKGLRLDHDFIQFSLYFYQENRAGMQTVRETAGQLAVKPDSAAALRKDRLLESMDAYLLLANGEEKAAAELLTRLELAAAGMLDHLKYQYHLALLELRAGQTDRARQKLENIDRYGGQLFFCGHARSLLG